MAAERLGGGEFLNCPSCEDEKLGVLYSVPVRVDTWRELVRCMEEEVCELERKLKKRKQGAAETEDDGLEVAPAKAAPSKDREAPKRKAGKTAKAETDPAKADLALAKNKQKTEKANQRAADLAARGHQLPENESGLGNAAASLQVSRGGGDAASSAR